MYSLVTHVTHLCLDFLTLFSAILAKQVVPASSVFLSLSVRHSQQPTALDSARPLTLCVSVVKSICVTACQK